MTIEEFARRIKKLMADIPQPFSNYLAEAIAPEVKAKVKEIFDKWVNNYYASYSPIYYSRTYGLRDAYVCEVYGNLLVFESDASLLNGSHRVSNEYIYDRMFFEGWHGGADKGEGHPVPGSLYWRSPFKEYTHWGAMAASSAAPGPKIQSDVKNYFKSGEWHKKVEAVGIDLLINRYGL